MMARYLSSELLLKSGATQLDLEQICKFSVFLHNTERLFLYGTEQEEETSSSTNGAKAFRV